MSCSVDGGYLGAINSNDDLLPFARSQSLDNVMKQYDQVEFSDEIVNSEEISFVGDRIFVGSDGYRLTTPILEQIFKLTSLNRKVLTALGDDRFVEDLNHFFRERQRLGYILRTVNGAAYSLTKQGGHRQGPLNHKAFLNGIAETLNNDFVDSSLYDVSIGSEGLRLLATHPSRQFDVDGKGDIQREGLEFVNNDLNSHKYEFHYHLLRTACANSTIFPHYFAAARSSFDGYAAFDKFLRDAMRMFEEGADVVPAYKHMIKSPLDIDVFDEAFRRLSKVSSSETNKILHPYLLPDLRNKTVVYNTDKIERSSTYDLFNDLTHYSKRSPVKIQRKAQEFAGEMVLNIMKDSDRRIRW